MRTIFLCSLIVLSLLMLLAVTTLPENRSHVPHMYWETDPNPARIAQIHAFEQWMKAHNYGDVDVDLDTNNQGTMKVIIQAASGVGSDIVDVYGGGQLRQYVAAGVLRDMTDVAKQYGFTPDKTYRGAYDELTVNGRQYAFPCNVTTMPLTINRTVLERDHLPLPKFDWTWDEFLQWCLAVKQVDNRGQTTRFAVMPFGANRLWQTNGASMFNEAMTRCVLDAPSALEATQFYYDLMFKYHVMPTPVDQQAAAQAGYGGLALQWLGQGKILAVAIGRYGQIQLRRFPDFVPDVALLPYKVMPMITVSARAAAVNAVSPHPKLAARFLQFLTSTAYNNTIVDGADALPPSPTAARSPAFVHPQDYPNEGDANVKYRRAAEKYGVSGEFSPFVSPIIVNQIITKYFQGVESQVLTPRQAMLGITQEINLELQRTIGRDPQLHEAYEKAVQRQQQIDDLKAHGKPVPLDWIADPVLRRLQEDAK